MTIEGLEKLSKKELVEVYEALNELDRRERQNKIATFYPDTGPLRRELYKKHLEFFKAGATYRERCIIAANRIGKSEGIGAYEMTLHLTGLYPDWWEGRRFDRAVRCWAAGDTGKTVRDIIQLKLLGPPGDYGTGMIPGELVIGTTSKHGLPEAVESIRVKHVTGDESHILLKSYDQRREAFQGTEIDVGWADEECPVEIWSEMLMRTMTTNGILMLTFTPLMGMTPLVQSFMPGRGVEEPSEVVH